MSIILWFNENFFGLHITVIMLESQNMKIETTNQELIQKAEVARAKGFNIYQLVNRFYKNSKLAEKIPDEVIIDVLNEFILRGDSVRDHWPYFIAVLKTKSQQHFSKRSESEGKKLKKNDPVTLKQFFQELSKGGV